MNNYWMIICSGYALLIRNSSRCFFAISSRLCNPAYSPICLRLHMKQLPKETLCGINYLYLLAPCMPGTPNRPISMNHPISRT